MAAEMMPYRFTVDEYLRMGEAGILDEDDRVELIDGEIVHMAAIGVKHANCVAQLNWLLNRLLSDAYIVRVQDPIFLSEIRMPQPDLAVVRRRTYETHPTPADVLLLIEVSDSTLTYDRGRKLVQYAQSRVAEVWIVDVNGGIIERFTEPRSGTYQQSIAAEMNETMTSTTIPEVTVAVDAVIV